MPVDQTFKFKIRSEFLPDMWEFARTNRALFYYSSNRVVDEESEGTYSYGVITTSEVFMIFKIQVPCQRHENA